MSKRMWLTVGGVGALAVAASIVALVFTRTGRSPNANSSPSPISTKSPTVDEIKAEVERDYLRYWAVTSEALESLDTSRLPEVLTGEALETTRASIEEQRSRDEPVRTQVEHNYQIFILTEFATVDDTFVDRSVRIDAKTRQPVGPAQNKTIRNSYTMRKEGKTWKVAEIIGYRSPSP